MLLLLMLFEALIVFPETGTTFKNSPFPRSTPRYQGLIITGFLRSFFL